MATWKRPSESEFPKVYGEFVRNGEKYHIQDIPEDRYEEACKFMLKHFIPYEPKLVSRNGKDDPDVLTDYFKLYMIGLKQRASVACFKENLDDSVGVSLLEVLGRNDPPFDFKVKILQEGKLILNFYFYFSVQIEDLR